jgi:nitrite reductase/ring-hydroxylating ferredoxin subunit
MAPQQRVIADGADLADGGPGVRFTIEHNGRAIEAFAIRHRGIVHAYVNACAHQEVELDWVPGAFFTEDRAHLVCSLHGALYAPATGRCVAGPCHRAALARIGVSERAEDGAIVLSANPVTPRSG